MSRIARTVAGGMIAAFMATSALAASPEEMVKGAKGLEEAFLKAFNEHNVEAIAACYWNNAETVIMPPDEMVVRGPGAIKASFAKMMETMKDCHLAITESHQTPVGDVVVAWGLFTLTTPGPDGKPMDLMGRFSDVKAQRDGKWVYLVDHASLPAPPPPPPGPPAKQ